MKISVVEIMGIIVQAIEPVIDGEWITYKHPVMVLTVIYPHGLSLVILLFKLI